jgi:uncharacterized membrane protein YqjE
MPEPVAPPSPGGREVSRGFVAELLGVLSTFGQHLQALATLAGLESREAVAVYLRVVFALIVALMLAAFGYLLGLLFVAFLLAKVFAVDWLWISLGLAVGHFVGVGVCALYLRAKVRQPVFSATAEELRRDWAAMRNFKP